MKIEETKLKDVLLITPEVFEDHRGKFYETFNAYEYQQKFNEKGIILENFVQDDVSFSYKNVLRGIHGDKSTWKLIQCLQGRFFVVVVDLKPVLGLEMSHEEYMEQVRWHSFILSAENKRQLLVPPNHGLGILALDDSLLHYKQTQYYQGMDKQFTIPWNDKNLNIPWPINNPILSKRDYHGDSHE